MQPSLPRRQEGGPSWVAMSKPMAARLAGDGAAVVVSWGRNRRCRGGGGELLSPPFARRAPRAWPGAGRRGGARRAGAATPIGERGLQPTPARAAPLAPAGVDSLQPPAEGVGRARVGHLQQLGLRRQPIVLPAQESSLWKGAQAVLDVSDSAVGRGDLAGPRAAAASACARPARPSPSPGTAAAPVCIEHSNRGAPCCAGRPPTRIPPRSTAAQRARPTRRRSKEAGARTPSGSEPRPAPVAARHRPACPVFRGASRQPIPPTDVGIVGGGLICAPAACRRPLGRGAAANRCRRAFPAISFGCEGEARRSRPARRMMPSTACSHPSPAFARDPRRSASLAPACSRALTVAQSAWPRPSSQVFSSGWRPSPPGWSR
eukprot:scaffold10868_cov121-Isochrysis_galbana.AAC.3